MPAHISRLLLLLAAFLALAVTARNYVLDPSYYQFGSYRGDAVVELAAGQPQFRGAAYCQACHLARHTEWTASPHRNVKCEVCHGAAREHPATGALPKPEDTIKLCTLCHEAMPGRPATQPQIIIAEHPFKHDAPLQCIACHNPHSPKIGSPREAVAPTASEPVAQAPSAAEPAVANTATPPIVAPLIAPCTPCHGADGLGVGPYPVLAGSNRIELARQLEAYRSGALQDPLMNAFAQSLSDEDITSLAGYFSTLPGGPTP